MKKMNDGESRRPVQNEQRRAINPQNFQGSAREQGEEFERECLRALLYAGFEISDQKINIDTGAEIDILATNRQGVTFAIECKGSLQGKRQSLKRTDTLRKAICNAYLLSISPEYSERFPPLLVMRSHEPNGGVGRAALDAAIRNGIILDVVDSRAGETLQFYANATVEDLERTIEEHRQQPVAARAQKKARRPKRSSNGQAPLLEVDE